MDKFSKEKLLVARIDKSCADMTVSWSYPASYSIGMSGLGYQLIWWLLEQEPCLKTYRTFTDIAEPGWQKSEMIGFTLSWELDYANILSLLTSASIPLLSSERRTADPLVFGGGPVLTANPEPFAEIFDVILLGDAEITIPNLIRGWQEARRLPDRQARLLHLSGIAGLYVPSLYRYLLADPQGPLKAVEAVGGLAGTPTRQSFMAPDYLAHSVILSPDTSWANMFLLELTRSCPQECRFCLASYLTRPFRFADIDAVVHKIEFACRHTKRIGIVGPSVTEHPRFGQLAEALLAMDDLCVSLASIRMDTIEPLVLQMLVRHGQKSLTIALESGSERLRRLMNKNLSEGKIFGGMELIAASGIEQVKFYLMVGLPEETEEDLDETVRLLTAIKKKHRRLRLIAGISSFVPKAQTPFQWSPRDRLCAHKQEYLRKRLARLGIDVRTESHNWGDVQTLLSRADRRITPVLLELSKSKANLGAWKRAFRQKEAGRPDLDFYVYRQLAFDECLPWSHLMDVPKQEMLGRQRRVFEAESRHSGSS
jgi:radical SAM superfamily enzyme YgiQ (UPF0313 family)